MKSWTALPASLIVVGLIVMACGSDSSTAAMMPPTAAPSQSPWTALAPTPSPVPPVPTAEPASSNFRPTGSMSTQRWSDHTATLLPDGRVLVVGGYAPGGADNGVSYPALVETYDPNDGGAFGENGLFTDSWSDHTATLLSDGRVLIAGGWNGVTNLASAELYDPKGGPVAIGTCSSTGSMETRRSGHTATLLSDGRVLIAGGSDGTSDLRSAELYDPKIGTFRPTGSMTTPRSHHTATLLSDGRVLIAGGTVSSHPLASAELHDPKSGTFSPTSAMTSARAEHSATLLRGGGVLIAGGFDGDNILASAELYNPKAGTFGSAGSMAFHRSRHTATLLADGRVLIAGGYGTIPADGELLYAGLASAELYAP